MRACSATQNFFLGFDKSVLWKVIVNKNGLPFEIFLLDKVNICFEQNFAGHNEIHLLYQSSLVVSDLRSETKGSRFESGCQLCAEVSSLQ